MKSEKPTYEELEKRVEELEKAESERIESEADLRSTQKRFIALYEQAPVGIAVLDSRTGQFLDINDAFCRIVGYPKPDMLVMDFMRITHPDDLQEDLDNMVRLRAGEISRFQMEKRYFRNDGSIVWVSLTVVPLWEERADPLQHIAIVEDITERKRSKEALKASEQKFRNIAENMPGVVLKYRLNPDGSHQLLYISKGVEDLFEVSRDDAVNDNKVLWDRIHPDDLERYAASLKESAQNLSFWELEHRIQLPDSRVKWVHNRGVPNKQVDGGVVWDALAVDITGRKNAEQSAHAAHTLLQQIMDNSLSVIVAKNRKGEYILANALSERLLGYGRNEMIGRTDYDLFPKETADRLTEDDEKVFETGEPLSIEEQFQIGNRNYSFLTTKFPLFNEKNEFYAICGMATDITERKRVEAELRKSKALLEATGRMARVGGWEMDPETSAVTWTDETYRIHEVPLDYMPPQAQALDFYPPDDRQRLSDAIQRASNHGEPYDLELGFVSAKNRHLWVRTVCQPVVVDGKTVKLSGTFQDITDRKNAELALKRALAEKETLLREVHHRVKNNMQVINSLLRMHSRKTADVHLKTIFDDCQARIGAMSLIHEALYQSDNLSRIDFKAYLENLCRNLGQVHDAKRKRIALTVGAADVSMNMDQGIAVGMIVAELVSNAFKHAFPNGEGGAVAVHLDRSDGETVRLIVLDTGTGLPPDLDIQNPSSLGLRLVTAAVTRELGGTVAVGKDGGTKYTIRFKCDN